MIPIWSLERKKEKRKKRWEKERKKISNPFLRKMGNCRS